MVKFEMNETKEWYKSKTMIVNILTIAAGVITVLAGQVEAGTPITIAAVINTILRVYTKASIK